jgi:hypothetical protein
MVINSKGEDALQASRRACSRGKKGMFSKAKHNMLIY